MRNPGPDLVQVNQHAAAFLRDGAQRIANQPAAIAALRSEDFAVEAPRVHPDEHLLLPFQIAANQRQVVLGIDVAGVGDRAKLAELGLDAALGRAADELLVLHPVADEVGDRDHFEVVPARKTRAVRARAPWCRPRS